MCHDSWTEFARRPTTAIPLIVIPRTTADMGSDNVPDDESTAPNSELRARPVMIPAMARLVRVNSDVADSIHLEASIIAHTTPVTGRSVTSIDPTDIDDQIPAVVSLDC